MEKRSDERLRQFQSERFFSFCKAGFRLLIAWYCWGLLVMRVTSDGSATRTVMVMFRLWSCLRMWVSIRLAICSM